MLQEACKNLAYILSLQGMNLMLYAIAQHVRKTVINMKKVVLIDDEPMIVEGLSRVINWKEYGCQVVGTAGNALEGEAIIRKFIPDILFTDIRMPNKDGLTMLAGLRSQFPQMQITVLTGYRDFEYAQTAIRLGVTRFLLKPSKMDELVEALEAMTQNIDSLKKQTPQNNLTDQGEQEPAQEAICESNEVANSFLVNNALKYIEENYYKKIALNNVAEHIYVSQWHLSKLLNKHTGNSFPELLNKARIKHAKQLMEDPSLKMWEISEMIGFVDSTHFSKIFKKMEGISANEYRNKLPV